VNSEKIVKIMEKVRTHKDLTVYKKSIDFVTEIYQFTTTLPAEEKYGLTSQLRRAAVSIPTNISEGSSRKSTKEYIQFLYISLGSISEIETLVEISKNLGLMGTDTLELLTNDLEVIKRMLISLIKTLKNK